MHKSPIFGWTKMFMALIAVSCAIACSAEGPTIAAPPGVSTGTDSVGGTSGGEGTDGTNSSTDGGCTAKCENKNCGPDGCGGFCGICSAGTSCTTSGVCSSPSCQPKCDNKQCGPDGCGGFCGICESGKACNGAGLCAGGTGECTPNCEGKSCGDDGCGNQCGKCPPGAICDANNQCEVNTSECGGVDDVGKCEQDGTIAVTCKAGQLIAVVCDPAKGFVCGYNPAKNKHECLKGSCSPTCEGKQCGPDGCGGICGQCQPGETCNTNGLCQQGNACTANCAGKQCGPDGCGGQCGICDPGTTCAQGVCIDPNNCTPNCNGKTCGPDGCGESCGTCKSDEVCKSGVCEDSDCTPSCIDKDCGDDGCGGACGACDSAQICDSEGHCVIQGGGACGSLTFEGKCINNGATVQWCEGGTVKEQDCNSLGEGLVCSWVASQETYWCVNQCQVACLGKECGPNICGQSCGECEENEACNSTGQCVPSSAGGACGDVTVQGSCEGITLTYCSNDEVFTVNCGEYGLVCGWDSDANWNGCIVDPNCTPDCLLNTGDPTDPVVKQCGDDGCGNQCGICGEGETCQAGLCEEGGTSECGNITMVGECNGDVLQYCAAGQLYVTDCSLAGEACFFDNDAGWYDCGDASTASSGGPLGGLCSTITAKGYCSDNTLMSCAIGTPTLTDCGASGLYCAYEPANTGVDGQYQCITPPACVGSCPEGTRCQSDGTCGCDGVDLAGHCEGDTLVYCSGDQLYTLDCLSQDLICDYNGTLFVCL
ncbi:MAG: hypothetical protein VX223_18385 [Myxococcota bacterium]|nr:hypothetical protein [Myxococcota bacterium]